MKLIVSGVMVILLMAVQQTAVAQEFHGKIVKVRGNVYIKDNAGVERTPEVSDYIAVTDEEINTHSGGKAVVRFTNGSMSVIGENSTLGIEKPTLFSHIKGKILFAFNRTSGPTRMVRTNSAVFGVRATSFIVQKDEKGEILALQEGLVNVESPDDAFEIHKTTQSDEFNSFKSEMNEGVKEFKNEGEAYIRQMKDDYVAFKKTFLLKPDTMITISGNRVDETPIREDLKEDFRSFEDFAGPYIDEFIKK